MPVPLLSMHNISKRFGATRALDGVSFEVQPGEVMALIGENGAGKSTLMKVLSGAYRPDGGRMDISGSPYKPADPHEARAQGIAMIYQELNLAADLSVEDNVMLGQEVRRGGLLRRKTQRPRVVEALQLLGHPDLRPEMPVQKLSLAAQQLVEIARALVMDAKLIVFDEPTSSLTQKDADHLFHVIRKLRDEGIGVIYISHFLEEVREVCDGYTVLRDGQSVGTGELAATSEAEIVALMVGRNVGELFPAVPHEMGPPLLSLERISGRHAPIDVSIEVRRGEILGIAGLVGSGRTELLRCLFGLDPVVSGRISIARSKPADSPKGRIAAGFGLVSEDRKGEGLAQIRSIGDNMTYSRLAPYSTFGWLRLRRRAEAVQQWMTKLRIKARTDEQPINELSGGNQQKVALARVLHQEADLLLLDEPTRGIDVGTKAEIYQLMGQLAAEGKSLVFVSSYFTELLQVCDRIAVMARGRLREIRPAGEWTEESLMHRAIGTDELES